MLSPIGGRHQELVSSKKLVRISRRKCDRNVDTVPQSADSLRSRSAIHPLPIWKGKFCKSKRATEGIGDFRIDRIDGDVAKFESRMRRPIQIGDRSKISSTTCTHDSAILLSCVNPVRKIVAYGDMIDLSRRLVIPRTPSRASIKGNSCALVTTEKNSAGIVRINPHIVRIVSARSTLESFESVSTIGRAVDASSNCIDDVGISRVNKDTRRIVALSVGNSRIICRHFSPISAAVVGSIQSKDADDIHSLRVRVLGNGQSVATKQSR